jgi:branched-chain amino acid transport system permease protein
VFEPNDEPLWTQIRAPDSDRKAERSRLVGGRKLIGVTAHRLLPLPFAALLVVGMAFGGLATVAIELGVYRTLRVRRVPLMNQHGFLSAIKAFVAATLGGLGSISGAMVGGIVFGLIETFAAVSISTSYTDAVGMILLILILLVWPEGLVGLIRRER